MARAIEFDYDGAIEQATQLFWEGGYAKTSLRDLLKAMKIGEGSFYNTFKSKKQIYLECLKYYNNKINMRRSAALMSAPNAKLGVRAFLQVIVEDLDNCDKPRVCLMARSISSEVFADCDLQKYIQDEMSLSLHRLTERLTAAKDAGEFPPEFDPETITQIITTYINGLFRTALVCYDRQQIEKQIDVFLTGLGI